MKFNYIFTLQMNDICRRLELKHYIAGDVIFHQGDNDERDKKVFILLSGSCDLKVVTKIDLTQGQSEIREKHVLTYNKRGQYFGERAIQFDEARSGTVICTEDTSLVTVSKDVYLEVLAEAKRVIEMTQAATGIEHLGTKESVLRILAKMRDKRSNKELDAVAQYLFRRIPFFQKFNMEQLIELCRVAETVSVWGRSILFKQGQLGQAFYVILSGTVEVWVNRETGTAASGAAATHSRNNRSSDLTAGLGDKVNELVSGEIFGERALESEDSMRMASIVTCDGNTELIVISREDYHNLVYVMMHSDSMARLSLLRKTELFRSVDVMHLKGLARFMEPRQYQINEVIYKSGTKATEIIIIESGECRVETEVKAGVAPEEFIRRNVNLTTPHFMEGTEHLDGRYHEGEDGVTPFHEDPYHKHHPELGHQHPTDAEKTKATNRRGHGRTGGGGGGGGDSRSRGKGRSRGDGGGGGEGGGRSRSTSPSRSPSPTLPGSPSRALAGAVSGPGWGDALQQQQSQQQMGQGGGGGDGGGGGGGGGGGRQEGDPPPRSPKRHRKDRLLSTEMVQMGKTRLVNLGRIAPNSVLATYVAGGSLGDEVFHPETVVASSLVSAYSIGNTFFVFMCLFVFSMCIGV